MCQRPSNDRIYYMVKPEHPDRVEHFSISEPIDGTFFIKANPNSAVLDALESGLKAVGEKARASNRIVEQMTPITGISKSNDTTPITIGFVVTLGHNPKIPLGERHMEEFKS